MTESTTPDYRLTIVRRILTQAMQLPDNGAELTETTELPGELPELDEAAVARISRGIEQQFNLDLAGASVDDDSLASVRALMQFVDRQFEQSHESARLAYSERGFDLQAEFIDLPSGRLFTLSYLPEGPPAERAVILCPPLAEEMNKARRLVSLAARRWCQSGYKVVVFDLFGTGDSEGEFAEGHPDLWQENISDIMQWQLQTGVHSTVLWGIRFGALLAAKVMQSPRLPVNGLLLWQPEISGRLALRQFMRLQTGANLLADKAGPSVADLETLLQRGEMAEIAGYQMAPELFSQCQDLYLALPEDGNCSVAWLQVQTLPQTQPGPAVKNAVNKLSVGGNQVNLITVEGPNFWSPNDVRIVPELVDHSLESLQSWFSDGETQ